MRDDFSTPSKEVLAKRVAFRCSNPKCGKLTAGPQADLLKAINIGVAAHITAAAPGGPRYESRLTAEQRASIENGIWLCQSCAKLIDNDPTRYSTPLLHQWKRLAEEKALAEVESARTLPRFEPEVNPEIDLTRLPLPTVSRLLGRDQELAQLRQCCEDRNISVAAVVGFGGQGKSALTVRFLDEIAPEYCCATKVFAWSFYSQGTHTISASSAAFFDTAIRFLDPQMRPPSDEIAKAQLAARLLRRQRVLFVLDGVEPLQYPQHELYGWFKDKPLRVFLIDVARGGIDGLVLVSSRQPLVEIERFPAAYTEIDLEPLRKEDGVELLRFLGVRGHPDSLREAVVSFDSHALTLVLLGRLLVNEYDSDIGQFRVLPDLANCGVEDASHAHRILRHYEEIWPERATEIEFLMLLGLADRPINESELQVLLAAPERKERFDLPASPAFRRILSRLEAAGLVQRVGSTFDTHPIVRTYFGNRFAERYPSSFGAAHQLLFTYFCSVPREEQPSSPADLEPLYRAVFHGCRAGRAREALDVYKRRVLRNGENYTLYRLGTFTSDLAALSCFLPEGWNSPPLAPLSRSDHNWLLEQISFCFLSLARMREAVQTLKSNLTVAKEIGDRFGVASVYRNLVESHLSLGEIDLALAASKENIALVKEDFPVLDRIAALTDRAYVFLHSGQLDQARKHFEEAEALVDDGACRLIGYAGFQYGEFLLATAQDEADFLQILDRADEGLRRSCEEKRQLHVALYELLKARALHGLDRLDEAVAMFRRAEASMRATGADEALAYLLITEAEEYRRISTEIPDVDTMERAVTLAQEGMAIAELGNLCIYQADGAIVEAAIAIDCAELDKATRAYNLAVGLVEGTGYGLRKPILQCLKEHLHSSRDGLSNETGSSLA